MSIPQSHDCIAYMSDVIVVVGRIAIVANAWRAIGSYRDMLTRRRLADSRPEDLTTAQPCLTEDVLYGLPVALSTEGLDGLEEVLECAIEHARAALDTLRALRAEGLPT